MKRFINTLILVIAMGSESFAASRMLELVEGMAARSTRPTLMPFMRHHPLSIQPIPTAFYHESRSFPNKTALQIDPVSFPLVSPRASNEHLLRCGTPSRSFHSWQRPFSPQKRFLSSKKTSKSIQISNPCFDAVFQYGFSEPSILSDFLNSALELKCESRAKMSRRSTLDSY